MPKNTTSWGTLLCFASTETSRQLLKQADNSYSRRGIGVGEKGVMERDAIVHKGDTIVSIMS